MPHRPMPTAVACTTTVLLALCLACPAVAAADIALYQGTMKVVQTSGALCGSNDKRTYPIEVVIRSDARGTDGYFRGRDISVGHFSGRDRQNLQVVYPFDDPQAAEGHFLALDPTPEGMVGELREKHVAAETPACSFDSASLALKAVPAGDAEAAWKESAALWQIELLNRRTVRLIETAQYAEAVEAARQSLDLCERQFGADSPASSTPLSNLAVMYRTLGRYSEAEPLCRRVLAAAEKNLGPEHPTVAIRLMNLAEVYEATGRDAQAEPLYRRALAIDEKALGGEHPDVAKVLNNLAVLYMNLGRYREAEPFCERALAIMKKVYGPDHPSAIALEGNLKVVRKKLAAVVGRI